VEQFFNQKKKTKTMKNFNKLIPALTLVAAVTLNSCQDNSNEARGEEAGSTDSTLLDNYNNAYPNNRIHMNDSNKAGDSSVMQNDTVPRKPAQ
jgi:hypothetical protein